MEEKQRLKNELEINFRARMRKYLSRDVNEMIKEHTAIIEKQNKSANAGGK